jgi:hypothetical protein
VALADRPTRDDADSSDEIRKAKKRQVPKPIITSPDPRKRKQRIKQKTGKPEGQQAARVSLRILTSCIGIKPLSLRKSYTQNWSANLVRSEYVSGA